MNNAFLNLVAGGTFLLLGILFILASTIDKKPQPKATPIYPASNDYWAITGSIQEAKCKEQCRLIRVAIEKFYDLHHGSIDRDVLMGLYASMLQDLDKKQKQLHAPKTQATV